MRRHKHDTTRTNVQMCCSHASRLKYSERQQQHSNETKQTQQSGSIHECMLFVCVCVLSRTQRAYLDVNDACMPKKMSPVGFRQIAGSGPLNSMHCQPRSTYSRTTATKVRQHIRALNTKKEWDTLVLFYIDSNHTHIHTAN